MPVELHTIAVNPNGSPLARPDILVMMLQKSLTFAAQANAITAIGAITPGTGFRMIPALAPTGGTGSGLQAVVTAMKAVGTPTVGSPAGTGYVNADTITLANGVVVTVATSAGGVPLTYTLTTPGSCGDFNMPTNPMPQVSTSGVGVGATVNILWGILSTQIINSGNYSVVPTLTITAPDGSGAGASFGALTLGGAGATIFVGRASTAASPFGVAPSITQPALGNQTANVGSGAVGSYTVTATANQPAFISCPFKRSDLYVVGVTPILAAASLVAGTLDVQVFG